MPLGQPHFWVVSKLKACDSLSGNLSVSPFDIDLEWTQMSMQPKVIIVMSIMIAAALSAVVSGVVTYTMIRRGSRSAGTADRLQLRTLNVVDDQGRIRISLSSIDNLPVVKLLDESGQDRINLSINQNGYGSVRLANPNALAPVAALEIDDKGAHVKFDRPGGASSYLFLNNSGGSGVVLLDSKGTRKLDILVSPSGETDVRRYDQPSDIAH